jgi:hypothetical protein
MIVTATAQLQRWPACQPNDLGSGAGPLIAILDGVQVTSCVTASYWSICSTIFGTKTVTSCSPASASAFLIFKP